MDIADLSSTEASALQRMLAYWVENWDWECPTLFGLERDDLKRVIAHWPSALTTDPATSTSAIVGVLRESLLGASAIPSDQLVPQFGMSQHALRALLERTKQRG